MGKQNDNQVNTNLSGEISDHIGQVASPQSDETLFFGNANEAVNNAFVFLIFGQLFLHMLNLNI